MTRTRRTRSPAGVSPPGGVACALATRARPRLLRRGDGVARRSVRGCLPDPELLQQRDLLARDLLAVLRVRVRPALQVQVPRVDRALVDQPVLLGRQVLQPIVPLRGLSEVA